MCFHKGLSWPTFKRKYSLYRRDQAEQDSLALVFLATNTRLKRRGPEDRQSSGKGSPTKTPLPRRSHPFKGEGDLIKRIEACLTRFGGEDMTDTLVGVLNEIKRGPDSKPLLPAKSQPGAFPLRVGITQGRSGVARLGVAGPAHPRPQSPAHKRVAGLQQESPQRLGVGTQNRHLPRVCHRLWAGQRGRFLRVLGCVGWSTSKRRR